MCKWKSILKSNTLEWLLNKNNPSVRYFTLIDILDYPENDTEVIESKKDIMKSKLISAIMSKQKKQGYWEKSTNLKERYCNSSFWRN
jgi:hypothetical protein